MFVNQKNKNVSTSTLDVILFLESIQKSHPKLLSYAQKHVLCLIARRNGINPDYAVSHKDLAKDMEASPRYLHIVIKPLIALNIIKLDHEITRKGKEDRYKLSLESFQIGEDKISTIGSYEPEVIGSLV